DHVVASFIPLPTVLLRFAYRSLREQRSPFARDAKRKGRLIGLLSMTLGLRAKSYNSSNSL
ncbi:hypothetical protein, partial [Klebsiella pneumoniae]|uniref:hypothetical protein n=1 Tax=Klebsiella pneumoniae TaxID=573 RepID=UPI0027302F51